MSTVVKREWLKLAYPAIEARIRNNPDEQKKILRAFQNASKGWKALRTALDSKGGLVETIEAFRIKLRDYTVAWSTCQMYCEALSKQMDADVHGLYSALNSDRIDEGSGSQDAIWRERFHESLTALAIQRGTLEMIRVSCDTYLDAIKDSDQMLELALEESDSTRLNNLCLKLEAMDSFNRPKKDK